MSDPLYSAALISVGVLLGYGLHAYLSWRRIHDARRFRQRLYDEYDQ